MLDFGVGGGELRVALADSAVLRNKCV